MCALFYGYSRLAEVIRARRPLLMLDRVRIDPDAKTAQGIKAVSCNEPYFPGHFPGAPIMPGVLQLAALTQAAEAYLRGCGQLPVDCDLRLTRVNRYKFRNPALPGDRLSLDVELREESGNQFVFKGTVVCADKTVSAGEFALAVADELPDRENPDGFCPEVSVSDLESEEIGMEECEELMQDIPHRFPFLLVDRQLSFTREDSCNLVIKNVSGGEEFFAALPRPAVPGYLLAEIAAQACCALAFDLPENRGKLAYYMSIDKAVFNAEVVPGDQLLIRVVGSIKGKLGSCQTVLSVGKDQVASLVVKFIFVDREDKQ